LLRIAATLEGAVEAFAHARTAAAPTGEYEAPLEAWNLSSLVIRTLDDLCLMARTDMALVAPAMQCARAALEHTVRAIWLLHPPERFAAEVRWLALVQELEKYEAWLAREAGSVQEREKHQTSSDRIRLFREGVAGRLPVGYQPLGALPNMRQMMSEIGIGQVYEHYRTLSQPVHGTMRATRLFHRNLENTLVFGDFSSLFDWILPMRISWIGIRELQEMLLFRCGPEPVQGGSEAFNGADIDEQFKEMALRAYEQLPASERKT
jgi:hypothetical protein